MSLMTSLNTGATGLDANSTDLSVIGDNIANANTIGYKASRAVFADAMAQSLIGANPTAANQRGLGTSLLAVQKVMSQGALSSTGLSTDLGIQGNGFFMVEGAHSGAQGTYFTRAGQFTIDKEGYLVNLEGLKVQGYTANNIGELSLSAVGPLLVGEANSQARATSNLTVKANLSADAVPPPAWDVTDAANTSNMSTSVAVYDSLGKVHDIAIYFRKAAAGSWEYYAVTDGGNVGGTAGTPTEVASGTMTFDTEGRLTDVTELTNNFTPDGATSPQALTFNFGTPLPGGTGLDGLTQFAGSSAVSFQNQDGYAAGDLSRINIDSQGRVIGSFTNGMSRPLGQVALASFSAPDQLMRVGGSLFSAVPAAGTPTLGPPSSGDRGQLLSGTLEQSNVDLAQEFVKMIAAQRGFQANSKTLTTADQLLQELMTIKR